MAGLHIPITADNGNFMRALHEVTAGVRNASLQIEADGGNIDRTISRIKNGLMSLGAGIGFKEITGAVANTRGEFQQLEVAFKTMLGSEEEAAKLMSQLVRTAAITPFDLKGVADGAKQLLAYGTSAEDVNETLVRLGDIAAGLSIPLGDLVYLYGTTMAQGRLYTQDLNQFTGRGIPMIGELAKQFGVAESKVKELVEAGKVGFPEVQKVIESLTNQGGKFGGLMEEQSKTISGQISNIEDAFDTMLNEIGKSQQGLISGTLDVTSTLVENWQTVLAVLGDIAVAYGVDKAILAGSSAVTSSSYAFELKELTALLPVKEANINLDVKEALAKGKITEATAEKVIAMRQEVKTYMESLAATKASATAEAQAAAQKYRAALQQSIAAKAAVAAKREELIASGQICGAYISENAIKEMGVVTEKAKAAAIQSTTAKQEYHAAVTKKKIATEALDTATTNANTAAQNINARSTTFLTVAKEGLVKTTKKLYATMMAHPYALIAAAVMALGYGIYKLVTYQTDYQKGLDRLNEATVKCEQSISAESHEIDRLFGKLGNAKKGTKEWEEARDSIWSKYGKYLKSLGDEKTALNDVAAAYNLVTQEAKKAAKARAMDNFLKSEGVKFAEDMGNYIEEVYQLIKKTKGQKFADMNRDAIRDIVEGRKKVDSGFLKSFDQSGTTFAGVTYTKNELRDILTRKGRRRNEYKVLLEEAERKFGESIPSDNDTEVKEKSLSEAYTEASKRYKEATVKVAEMKKNRASYTQTQWENAQQELKDSKEAFEKLGGETKEKKSTGSTADQLASKQTDAHQKLIDLMKQQAEDRLKLQQEYEYQLWQNRIDLMQEGEAKIIAQMGLDHKKEQASLEEQKKQAIQAEISRQKAVFDARQDELAAGNKKYAKQVFDPTSIYDPDNKVINPEIQKIIDRYDSLNSDLIAKQQKAEADRLQAAKESFNAYLREFGSYQQKRKAIEDEYSKKINEAQNHGERKTAIAQRNKALADVDFNEWQENGGMALAFGDISKLSKETIEQLISDMEKYRSKIIATFDPDKIQKFEEALNNLRIANVDFDYTFASDNEILDSLRERLALQQQIADAEANEAELLNQKKQIERELNALTLQMMTPSINTDAVGPDGKETDAGGIDDETVKYADELRVKLDAVNKSLSSSTKNSKQLQSQLKALGKVKFADIQKFSKKLLDAGKNASDLASIFSDDVADAVREGADKIGVMFDAFTELSSNIETLAKSGKDVVKDTTDAAKGVVDAASGGMKASAASTAASLSTMEKASAILAIIGAAIQLATMVASLVNPDKKHEKNIQRIQDRIDVLQKSYDKLGEAADKAYSTDASKMIEQQNTLLQQQKVLIRQQMAEEEAKKKSDKDKIKEYQDQLEEIDKLLGENADKAKEAIVGKDIKSAIDEFASLYAGAWDDGTDAAQKSMAAVKSIISSALTELLKKNIQPAAQNFYDTLARAMEDGILTDAELANLDTIKRQMDALAAKGEEQYKKIQDRYKDLDELKEELTDISFDSVRDNFKSLLLDMESTTEDFTENWTDMIRNSLIEGLMDNKYDKMLKEWYDEFAEAMDDQTLTDEERERLRQQYNEIIQQGIADRNAINDLVGGGAYSQQASSGSSWNMNQETGDELNGRFTAMVELEATNNVLVSDGNAISREILATLRSMTLLSMSVSGSGDNSTLLDIKDMMFLSTGYLEDIAKYSKLLAAISSDVAEMKNKVKDL